MLDLFGNPIIPRCTLMHGDCLERMKEIPDGSVDMILTDIPYDEVNRKSSGLRNLNKKLADEMNVDLSELIGCLVQKFKGSIYIFCGIKQISLITELFNKYSLTTRLCVWEKNNPSPMNGSRLWLSGMEFCVFARKPKATFNEHCKKAIWKYPSGQSKIHPTQKPLKLMRDIIAASSNECDTILDPFMGSGTTGVACKNLNRDFIGIELDAEYFRIATERIFT